MTTYKLTVIEKDGFLHAVVTGQNSKEVVAQYLQDIYQACLARSCLRVLIEERLEGPRLGTMDLFDAVSEGSRNGRKLRAIAYVNEKLEGDLMQFAEHVAVNRGVAGRVFKTVAAAEEWLIKTAPAAATPGTADQSTPGS
jgi:hypothetical protein